LLAQIKNARALGFIRMKQMMRLMKFIVIFSLSVQVVDFNGVRLLRKELVRVGLV
jgi:hypothetical protein